MRRTLARRRRRSKRRNQNLRIVTRQTVMKKSVVEGPPSKPGTAKMTDIATFQVSDRFAALQVNLERWLTYAVNTRQAAIRAVTGAGFTMAVTAVIGHLLGLLAVG
jgi:hypothetical protein